MRTILRATLAIIRKDLRAELRTKESVAAMLVFAILVLTIFNFALGQAGEDRATLASGVLWVSFIFAGVLGLNRSFTMEKEAEGIQGLRLSPVDPSAIYLGKMVGNLIFMLVVEAITIPIFSVLFNFSLGEALWPLALVAFLSTLGFVAVGTLFAAMSVNTRTREVMLPLLLLPVALPVLIAAVSSTSLALKGSPLAEAVNWLKMLIAFDVIFVVVSTLVFEYVIEE
ncbi:MAG: heme exporter protein CcmB [Nitrospinota bacterium]